MHHRINLIGNATQGTGLAQDFQLLHGIFAQVLGVENITVRYVPHFHPQCEEAEMNFFLETVNPSLFMYAAKNIWIPNPEWTYRTWQPYANMIDAIWVKTREAEKLFKDWIDDPMKVRYIGWTSVDKVKPERKNYHKAIVPTGKNIWRNPTPIIAEYYKIFKSDPELFKKLPELHVVYRETAMKLASVEGEFAEKVILHSQPMKQNEYDELLHDCGLAICISAAEGFGHAVNEAMSAGCNLILSKIAPFEELTHNANWVVTTNPKEHPSCIATLYNPDASSLNNALVEYAQMTFTERRGLSMGIREEYEQRHERWIETMQDTILAETANMETYSMEKRMVPEADLPCVSIITPTRDRRDFIHLAKYNLAIQSYPQDKIEWVIVDDGNDQIKDMVSELPNVNYILCDQQITIGEKRNIGIEAAKHDVIVMMDDDDVYPNNSVLTRVATLMMEPKKSCVFSTVIPCYDICNKISYMNVPPYNLAMSQRVSEATLCFTKDFWIDKRFSHEQIAEGDRFIGGRERACREMSPQDVIVSLTHKKNASSRKAPKNSEPNGCHFGFSDELFTLVSEIAEKMV